MVRVYYHGTITVSYQLHIIVIIHLDIIILAQLFSCYSSIKKKIILLSQGVDSESTLIFLFETPFHATWSVILQTAGGPDADNLFAPTLAHRIMTYVLFITFLVAMPVLFNNFLVGLR